MVYQPSVPQPSVTPPLIPQPPVPQPPKNHTAVKVVGGIVAGIVVFGVGVATGAGGSGAAPAASPAAVRTVTVAVPGPTVTVIQTLTEQPTTTQPAGPKTQVTNGTFHVGEDIVAGRWKTDGPTGDSCYWERERNDSGDFSAIIANDNISGPTSITVNAGEFVKFDGGCSWSHS